LDKNQRIKHIINTLQVKNAISIKKLIKEFDVSEMTVRRDLTLLADDGIVELIPGGAILKTDAERDEERYLITHAEMKRTREKMKIGKKAASMIEPNDTLVIDVGSTTEYIAKFMQEEFPVTVLCYGLNILVDIYRKKNCNPIFAGGYFHDNTLMFESREGINLIKRTRADKAFISAAGVNEQLGVTCPHHYEVDTKQAVLKSAKTKILVTDSTKFGKVKIAYFADLQEFDVVITDSEIPEEYIKIIRNIGLDLYMA
jgi:DeoR family transcriptional regulator, deoxyribose operon repressor